MYQFYNDHGHMMKECIAIRFDVAFLLKKRLLLEFLTKKDGKILKLSKEKHHEAKAVEMFVKALYVKRIIG